MIVDAHTHVVSTDEARYPLQCMAKDPDDPRSWPLFAQVTAEQLAQEMSAAGVDRACLVQGYSAYRFDNRYAVDAAEREPDRFVSVCAVDIVDPQAPDHLEALARSPCMRGVRIVSGSGEGDPTLDSPEARRVWSVAERLGIVVVAFSLGDRLGVDRLLWGSDYPASHERSYRDWVELARTSTRHLDAAQAERFLAGTALSLWAQLGSRG